MSLQARRELLAATAPKYQQATKLEKQRILDHFVSATQYHRKYANRVLLQYAQSKSNKAVGKRCRKRIYGDDVKQALIIIWEAANQICSKRLVPFLPALLPRLEQYGYLDVNGACRENLLSISPATVDRLLYQHRHRGKKGLSTTKSGGLLKHQIPVRTHNDWDESTQQPGYFEADLVAHCGGDIHGQFLCTLTLTDVFTGWTECLPLLFRDSQHVIEALKRVTKRIPYPIKGLDTDNGTEFINYALATYCDESKITFTRCRPYKKNDQCFVEQKNGAIVRQFLGYDRFEGLQAYQQLDKIHEYLHLYVNYFQPSLKLLEKKRVDGRVKKVYDKAQTPYQRTVTADLEQQQLDGLKSVYDSLDPVALLKQIRQQQKTLWQFAHVTQSPLIALENTSLQAATCQGTEPQPNQLEGASTIEYEPSGDDAILTLPKREAYRQTKKGRKSNVVRYWRTRKDPFTDVWDEIVATLEKTPMMTATEIFDVLQEKHPDNFTDGQIRTLQRRVSEWRAEYAKQLREQSEADSTLAAQRLIVAPLLSRDAIASALDNNSDDDYSNGNKGVVKKILTGSTANTAVANPTISK